MRKADKVLLCILGWVVVNAGLGWLAFFLKGEVPDTLLTLTIGGAGLADTITGLIVIFDKKSN